MRRALLFVNVSKTFSNISKTPQAIGEFFFDPNPNKKIKLTEIIQIKMTKATTHITKKTIAAVCMMMMCCCMRNFARGRLSY
jgi:hypothetical protein